MNTNPDSQNMMNKSQPIPHKVKDVSLKGFLLGGIAILLVNGLLFYVFLFKEKPSSEVVDFTEANNKIETTTETVVTKESPELLLSDQEDFNYNEALDVLNAFTNALSDTERSLLVRNPEHYLKNSDKMKMSMKPRLGIHDKQSWSFDHVADTKYLRLLSKDENQSEFNAYFTREGESLKLDIAASLAWSEASMETQYEELNNGGEAIVRCLISRKEESYNGRFNDEEHASYLLRSIDEVSNLWGYVKRGSVLDNQLKELLDHGSFVVELKENVRVTIKVARKNKETLPSQVEILELLHKEWVSP